MKIKTKIYLSLLVPFFLIIFSGLNLYSSIQQNKESSSWVKHTHVVISEARLLIKLIVDMETGMRGFIITGKEEFLEPFYTGIEAWQLNIQDLKKRVRDNPPQIERLTLVNIRLEEWKKYIGNPSISARMNGEINSASALIEKGAGKEIVDGLRAQLQKFIEVEEALLAKREFRERRNSTSLIRSTIIATILGCLICIGIGFVLNRDLLSGVTGLLDGTKKIMSGKLDSKVDLKDRGDELFDLANSFNAMTKQLVDSRNKLEKANKAKGQFLANMSHEIRTPLNGILGFASLLCDEPLNKKSVEYVEHIQTSCENLLLIINDILDYSKIEAGKVEIEKFSFSLKDLVKSNSAIFFSISESKGLAFEIDIDSDIPSFVSGDKLRINQVLLNLLSNAFKFTEQGSIKLSVKRESNIFSFEVRDTGLGIAKDKISKVFFSFQQADESTTREFGGTGLGLSISSKLVEMMGGELKVESELNKGSRFYFSIPLGEAEDANISALASGEDLSSVKFEEELSILVVEDNLINQKVLVKTLEKIIPSATIEVVENGQLAVEACFKNTYHIVFMDIQMPVMGGLESTKLIVKKLGEDLNKRVPFIIGLSANAYKSDIEEGISAGMSDYLTKPVKAEDIARVIGKFKDI